MNIHFTDIELKKRIDEKSIACLIMGSNLYGTNNENSDIDYLSIYVNFKNQLYSFLESNHQMQYKSDSTDFVYVDLVTFVKNLLNGDSTINLELLHSNDILNTDLKFLADNKEEFYNYNICKSYLGMSKRDLKDLWKKATKYEKIKKLVHSYRGMLYFDNIISKSFNFETKKLNDKKEYYLNISDGMSDKELHNFLINECSVLDKEIADKRNFLNTLLNDGKINRVGNIDFLSILDMWLKDYLSDNLKDDNLDMSEFYFAMEKGNVYY